MPSLKAKGAYGPLFDFDHAFVDSPSLNELSAIAPRSLPSAGIADQSSCSTTSAAAPPPPRAAATRARGRATAGRRRRAGGTRVPSRSAAAFLSWPSPPSAQTRRPRAPPSPASRSRAAGAPKTRARRPAAGRRERRGRARRELLELDAHRRRHRRAEAALRRRRLADAAHAPRFPPPCRTAAAALGDAMPRTPPPRLAGAPVAEELQLQRCCRRALALQLEL